MIWSRALLFVSLTSLTGGCLLAAAGAGAGGAIYLGDRGAESVVAASVEQTLSATRAAFKELEISETKASSVEEAGGERRSVEGTAGDREVKVAIRTEGQGAKVEVVVQRSAVTWDKDFAKRLLERIVALAKA